MQSLLDHEEDFRVLIESSRPVTFQRELGNKKTNKSIDILILAQRLGEDIGQDTLVTIDNYFRMAIAHTLRATKPHH